MLIDGSFSLAVGCGVCGKIETHEISLFRLTRGKYHPIYCSCGETALAIKTENYKTFYFAMSCTACEEGHVFQYTIQEIQQPRGRIGKCPAAKETILWIGGRHWIRVQMEQYSKKAKDILKESSCRDYFHNPDIMLRTLDCIHEIALRQRLYCDCGSRAIEMQLFPDRIELHCTKCKSMNMIYAETEDDLAYIIKTHAIIMREKAFACIDAINYTRNMKNNS